MFFGLFVVQKALQGDVRVPGFFDQFPLDVRVQNRERLRPAKVAISDQLIYDCVMRADSLDFLYLVLFD